jgi:hypothetical protein
LESLTGDTEISFGASFGCHEGEVALAQATALAKKSNIDLEVARSMMKQQSVRRAPSNSSSTHPADRLFVEINTIMSHVPGARHNGKGDRMRSGTTYAQFGSEVVVWGVSHDGTFVLVVLPIQGEKERPIMWYLVHADPTGRPGGYSKDDVLAKSTNAQDLIGALRSVDWKGLKVKRDAEQREKEQKAYNNAQKLTPEAEAVVRVAEKHGYVLKPASTGESYREMVSDPYRLIVGPDGAWWHETRQGGSVSNKWKLDTKRFDQKNKGPQAFEKWVTTKRKSGEAAFSVHDEINKMVKVLTSFGFRPFDKQGNQHIWSNTVEMLRVTFGPNKMRGAMKKDDEVWWMITAEFVRKDSAGGGMRPAHDIKALLGDKSHGKDSESLERSLSVLMKKAEMGFDKIVNMLSQFEFRPNDKVVDRPDPTKEYFSSKGGKYFAVVDPKTGRWSLQKHWNMGMGSASTLTLKDGHTAEELLKALNQFKAKFNEPKDE